MKGKMLMFAEVSLISFVYNIIDILSFPTVEALDVCKQNKIIKCLIFLNLTDNDSCSISFIFVLRFGK